MFVRGILFVSSLFSFPKKTKTTLSFLESGDPEVGMLLTKGKYIFSRVNLDLQTDNPWLIEAPSLEVENSLHGFDWLNDLSASGNDKSQRLARDWMLLWYEIYGNGNFVSWSPETTALRTINLFKNWRFVQKSLKLKIKCYQKILKKTQFYLSKIQLCWGRLAHFIHIGYVFLVA